MRPAPHVPPPTFLERCMNLAAERDKKEKENRTTAEGPPHAPG